MSDKNHSPDELNAVSREAWDSNARVWDAKMAESGNDFFNVLCWPVMVGMLNLPRGQRILDVACGNGLTSRKLHELGAQVTAFDFSANLVEIARQRTHGSRIDYRVLDATDESALLALGEQNFDSAFSNMALFDMPQIEPLFRALSRLLKPGGVFVFSITHPAFNNPSCNMLVEEWDDGSIQTRYAIKTSKYITPFHSAGLALRNQPKPQLYFHRPLEAYFKAAFTHGFIVDDFAERAFPPEIPQTTPLGWGGNFSELPPVAIFRVRKP